MAIKYKPNFAAAYNNKGSILSTLGKHQEAIKNFDIALQYNPQYPEAYYNKGISLIYLWQHQEAIENYDLALKYKPNYAESYNNKEQGVSERSVDELREYANTPQFCETNSSKQKSISATILCFFMLFIVKMLFTVGYFN